MKDFTFGKYSLSGGIKYTADFMAGAAGGFVGSRVGGVYGAVAGRHLAKKYIEEGAYLIYYGTTTPYPTQSVSTQSPMSSAAAEQVMDDMLDAERRYNHDGSYIDYIISNLV